MGTLGRAEEKSYGEEGKVSLREMWQQAPSRRLRFGSHTSSSDETGESKAGPCVRRAGALDWLARG